MKKWCSSLEEEMVISQWRGLRGFDEGLSFELNVDYLEVDLLWENSKLNFYSPKANTQSTIWLNTFVFIGQKALSDAQIPYSVVEQACVGYVYGMW